MIFSFSENCDIIAFVHQIYEYSVRASNNAISNTCEACAIFPEEIQANNMFLEYFCQGAEYSLSSLKLNHIYFQRYFSLVGTMSERKKTKTKHGKSGL